MSVDNRGLREFQKKIEALRDDVPDIMSKITVGEGVFAVEQAVEICKAEHIVDSGAYQMNFHCGDKALIDAQGAYDGSPVKRYGTSYRIDIYNNLDYAKPLEYGFRSHYVPPQHLSGFYRKKFPKGMYVGTPGEWVNGHFTLRRAIRRTKDTQEARIQRKINQIIRERLG